MATPVLWSGVYGKLQPYTTKDAKRYAYKRQTDFDETLRDHEEHEIEFWEIYTDKLNTFHRDMDYFVEDTEYMTKMITRAADMAIASRQYSASGYTSFMKTALHVISSATIALRCGNCIL
jgi:hypothetical protein